MRLKPAIYENTRVPPPKEANPASLRSTAPSKGRGSRGHSLLPMEGGAPKGRRLDGGSGLKKIGGDRLKCAVNESTRAPLTRSPFPNGEGKEEGALPPPKEANPASLRSAAPSKGRGSRGHSLLPMEGGAPKGRRLDGGSGMKKSGKIISSAPFARAPYPPLTRSPFPNGEGYDTREHRYPHIVKANTCMCGKTIPPAKPSPRGEGGERRFFLKE